MPSPKTLRPSMAKLHLRFRTEGHWGLPAFPQSFSSLPLSKLNCKLFGSRARPSESYALRHHVLVSKVLPANTQNHWCPTASRAGKPKEQPLLGKQKRVQLYCPRQPPAPFSGKPWGHNGPFPNPAALSRGPPTLGSPPPPASVLQFLPLALLALQATLAPLLVPRPLRHSLRQQL